MPATFDKITLSVFAVVLLVALAAFSARASLPQSSVTSPPGTGLLFCGVGYDVPCDERLLH